MSKIFKFIRVQYFLKNLYFILTSGEFIWHCFYLGVCIGAIGHPLVVVFQIFDNAIKSDTIHQIGASIVRNARQFGWVFFLLLVTNLVCYAIGFFFYNDLFSVETSSEIEMTDPVTGDVNGYNNQDRT